MNPSLKACPKTQGQFNKLLLHNQPTWFRRNWAIFSATQENGRCSKERNGQAQKRQMFLQLFDSPLGARICISTHPQPQRERHNTINHGQTTGPGELFSPDSFRDHGESTDKEWSLKKLQMQTVFKPDKEAPAWGPRKALASAGIIRGFGPFQHRY